MDKIIHAINKMEDPQIFDVDGHQRLISFTDYIMSLVEILYEDNECRTNDRYLLKYLKKELKEQNENGQN